MINLVPSSVSKLPSEVHVEAGYLNLFVDPRVDWVMERLGGCLANLSLVLVR